MKNKQNEHKIACCCLSVVSQFWQNQNCDKKSARKYYREMIYSTGPSSPPPSGSWQLSIIFVVTILLSALSWLHKRSITEISFYQTELFENNSSLTRSITRFLQGLSSQEGRCFRNQMLMWCSTHYSHYDTTLSLTHYYTRTHLHILSILQSYGSFRPA